MSGSIKEIFEELKKNKGVEKVVLVSRTGMFIEGDDLENQDTFSAMSAIVLGASETATSSIGDVEKITVDLEKGHKLVITPAGKRGVLAVITKEDFWEKIKEMRDKLKDVI